MTNRDDLKNRTFIAIVEDNEDPKKIGRIRARVLDVFDEIPADQIPWASPWKDLNGNSFNIPDKGKVVTVIFEDGNIYSPEYIYADHYNINLATKLNELSGANYTSMKSIIFDHKTQLYVNDKEGLKFDYKFNNINIKDTEININLKDNFSKVNIGTAIASQRAILGDHFLNWFDDFVDNLLGSNAGPYLGNLGAPVVANPTFINCLLKYKALKEPKFLSHHINLVDNEDVEKLDRVCNSQIGDKWKSTVRKNDLVSKEPVKYKPKAGQSTDPASGEVTPPTDDNGNPVQTQPNTAAQSQPEVEPSVHDDINKIFEAMKAKGYKILDRPYEINIVGIRRQYEGMAYSNSYMDSLYAIYKDDSGNWAKSTYPISTIPGLSIKDPQTKKMESLKKYKKDKATNSLVARRPFIGTLQEAQYLDVFYIGEHLDSPAMKTKGKQKAYRDENLSENVITYTSKNNEGNFGMLIHKGYVKGTSSAVNNWSEGCQVFRDEAHLTHFFDLCNKHKAKYGNTFNYTLMLAKDVNL
jgi:hypothetical protein